MPEATVFGFECKLYYDSADTPSTPTWAELDVIKDVTLQLGFSESDASIRAAGGFQLTEPALLEVSIEGTLEWINGNAKCMFLWDKFFSREPINIMALTGLRTNADAEGVKGDFKIVKFPRKEELKESVKFDFTLKPSRSTRSNFVQKATGVAT